MPQCLKCGSELKEGAKFCTKCGARITLTSPESVAQIDILKKRIEKDSLNAKLYVELGNIYQQNDLLQEALIEYQKAVNIDSSNYDAHLKSGDIYFKLEQLEKAANSYQDALRLDSKSRGAKLGLFRAYHFQDKVEQAIELGEEIIKTEPENLEAHRALKELYVKKEMKEKTLKELEAISSLAPEDKQSLKELSGLYEERAESEKELKCYQKVLELDPRDTETRFNLGRWYCAKGEYQKAIECLKDLFEGLPPELDPYARLYLALAYVGLQELDKAIKEIVLVPSLGYEELTARDKKLFAETYYRIGCAVLQTKNFSSAIDYLKKALKYDPQSQEYQKQLDTAKIEKTRFEKKAKRKTLAIGMSTVGTIILVLVGWYLSHGKIQIRITPADSVRVYVDGKRVVVPRSDWKVLLMKRREPELIATPSLFFGVHKVAVEKDGYEKWERDVKVGWGKTASIKVELVPIYGSLRVKSEPSRARVFLDETYLGETPFTIDTVTATQHVLILQKQGCLRYESSITIPAEKTLNLSIPLRQQTQTVDKKLTSKYTSVGTIMYLEYQGNNYLSITIMTSDSSKVWIWCSGGETTVYKNNYKTPWSDLKLGVKIGVIGEWGQMEGEKQLGAKRIDILIEEPNQAEAQKEENQGDTKEAQTSQQALEIPATQEWVDTGIPVFVGQELIIRVTGNINHGCSDCGASPKGGSRRCGGYHCGAVVAKIGPNGETFFVGDYFEGSISNKGNLYLGIVDTRYEDNRGEFTAIVSVK